MLTLLPAYSPSPTINRTYTASRIPSQNVIVSLFDTRINQTSRRSLFPTDTASFQLQWHWHRTDILQFLRTLIYVNMEFSEKSVYPAESFPLFRTPLL
ncbi:MAG TPA: hypothetical protein DCM07_04245 [Planctomycetaceae bacterium]|nr:hypothetical protein [Planctomycetaceae bacterium]